MQKLVIWIRNKGFRHTFLKCGESSYTYLNPYDTINKGSKAASQRHVNAVLQIALFRVTPPLVMNIYTLSCRSLNILINERLTMTDEAFAERSRRRSSLRREKCISFEVTTYILQETHFSVGEGNDAYSGVYRA